MSSCAGLKSVDILFGEISQIHQYQQLETPVFEAEFLLCLLVKAEARCDMTALTRPTAGEGGGKPPPRQKRRDNTPPQR